MTFYDFGSKKKKIIITPRYVTLSRRVDSLGRLHDAVEIDTATFRFEAPMLTVFQRMLTYFIQKKNQTA